MPNPDGEPIALQCLMGASAPPELGDNLATLLSLPEAVQQSYVEVLEPNLAPVIDDRVETSTKRYCRTHELDPQRLAPSVKACRFLFKSTVLAGVDRDALDADVRALLPDERAEPVLSLLLPLLDQTLPKLKATAAFQSVAEHGKVVRAVRWRVDEIKASDHGARLEVPVATITLQYQEGPNAGQTTFQFLPDQAAALRRALSNILD